MGIELLPQRLTKLRGERTLQEVADAVGVTRVAVGYYEKGDRTPDAKMVCRFAKYYGVSSDYLLGMSDVKKPDIDVQTIAKMTGLTEKAIFALGYISRNDKERLRIINLICEDGTENE